VSNHGGTRARARSFASWRIAVAEPRSSVGHGPCDRTHDAVAAGVAVTTPRASSDDLANSLLQPSSRSRAVYVLAPVKARFLTVSTSET